MFNLWLGGCTWGWGLGGKGTAIVVQRRQRNNSSPTWAAVSRSFLRPERSSTSESVAQHERWEFMFQPFLVPPSCRAELYLHTPAFIPVDYKSQPLTSLEMTLRTMEHADLVIEMQQVERLSTQDRLYLARMWVPIITVLIAANRVRRTDLQTWIAFTLTMCVYFSLSSCFPINNPATRVNPN